MKLSQLTNIVGASSLPKSDTEFHSVSIDTRTLESDSLFIALKGAHFNGHDFLHEAEKRGAVAAIVSEQREATLPLISVSDTAEALAKLACHYREQAPIPVVGITGSCGKTTTRALVAEILAQSGSVLASQKSFNNYIGVPLTLLQLKPEHQYVVLELGANHPGEIAQLTRWAKPTVAVVTSIGLAHLAGFGDLAGVAQAKGEIFQGLSGDGVAVINNNDEFAPVLKRLARKSSVLTFAMKGPADCVAEQLRQDESGCYQFILCLPQAEIEVRLPLMGEHNVSNALAAATAATALNIPITAIKAGLEKMSPVQGRLSLQKGHGGASIIDDSYNANPSSVLAAIGVLAARPGESLLIFGDMLELGSEGDRWHRKIGEWARSAGISKLYCYGPLSQLSAGVFGKNAHHFTDKAALIEAVKKQLHPGVTALVKGSFSMGMSQVVQALLQEKYAVPPTEKDCAS